MIRTANGRVYYETKQRFGRNVVGGLRAQHPESRLMFTGCLFTVLRFPEYNSKMKIKITIQYLYFEFCLLFFFAVLYVGFAKGEFSIKSKDPL